MKTITFIAVLLILAACSGKENKPVAPTEKSYTLRVESKEYSSVKRYDDKIMKYEIRAKSDSEAYEKSLLSFVTWQKAYDTAKTISLWKSESFTVLDNKDEDIVKTLNASTRQIIQNKFDGGSLSKDSVGSKKINQRDLAFKEWRFGMPVKNYSEKEIGFHSFGKHTYFFKPLFDESSGLYRIILESPETNAKSFESKVKKSYENLYESFSAKHGAGTKLNAFPAMKNLGRAYIKWLHEWNVGNKNIKIGIGALLNGVEYYSVAWITDKELFAANQTRMRNKVK